MRLHLSKLSPAVHRRQSVEEEESSEDLLVAAYAALKAEQTSRISLRDNYGLTYVASLATLFFGYYGTKSIVPLLAVPAVGFVGFHSYATNDNRISAIRIFLQRSLPSSMARDWEVSHVGTGSARSLRGAARAAAAAILFSGPAVAGLALIFYTQRSFEIRAIAISITVIAMALMTITYLALKLSERKAKYSYSQRGTE